MNAATPAEQVAILAYLNARYPLAASDSAPLVAAAENKRRRETAKTHRWRSKKGLTPGGRPVDTGVSPPGIPGGSPVDTAVTSHGPPVDSPVTAGRSTVDTDTRSSSSTTVVPASAVQKPPTTGPGSPVVSGSSPEPPVLTGEVLPRAGAATHPAVQRVLDAFHETFLTEHGSKPHITGKDAALAQQMVRRHGVDKVLEVMQAMFASTDPFILQAGHSLGILSSQWNKLVVGPRQALPARTHANLQVARAFVERRTHDRR